MILLRLMGGLGNQMFQYAFGRCLAVRRRVELRLDLRWFEENRSRQYRLDSFPIAASIASARDTEMLTREGWCGLAQRVTSGLPPSTWHRMPRTVMEQNLRYDHSHGERLADYLHYTGYWQCEKYFLPIADELRKTFHSRHARSAGFRHWSEMILGAQSVSIHVRRGDYLHDEASNRVHGTCEIEYFRAAMRIISGRVPNAHYFLFCEDPDWCRDFFKDDASALIVDLTGEESDLEQLDLMRLCRHHIISNSTFGWWGAWLATEGDSIVIAPRQWFADPALDSTDIVPDRWIRI